MASEDLSLTDFGMTEAEFDGIYQEFFGQSMQQQDALQEERAKREALQAQADNLALALVEQKRAAERMEADLVVANQLAQKLYDENVDLAHKVVNSEGLVQKLVAAGIEQQQQMATKDEHIARHKFYIRKLEEAIRDMGARVMKDANDIVACTQMVAAAIADPQVVINGQHVATPPQ